MRRSTKTRRSRISKEKFNMREEIKVLGDEADAKRLASRERQSSSELYPDDITIPPASDEPTIAHNGDDELPLGWCPISGDEVGPSANLRPLGWHSDPQSWGKVNTQVWGQTVSPTSAPSRKQPKSETSLMGFWDRSTDDGSPRDDSSSIGPHQDGIAPCTTQQVPILPSRGKTPRTTTSSRRATKQSSGSKLSSRRSRKGTAREDHDQDGDCAMGESEFIVVNKKEDNGPWVCPFFRRDPVRHMDCITLTLNRIQDVKQHLSRRHTAEHACSKCFEEFGSAQEWEEHVRVGVCLRQPCPQDRVSPEAQESLKRRVDRTLSAAEQWHEIYNTLFKGTDGLQNPHQGSVIGEVIRIIRDFWDDEGEQLLAELVRSRGVSENEARLLPELLGGLLGRVEDWAEGGKRDPGAVKVPSNTDNGSCYLADQTGRTLELDNSTFLHQGGEYDVTPKLSKSPPPTAPILPAISDSSFENCFQVKPELFSFDPSAENSPFNQYPNSAEDYTLSNSTISATPEENRLDEFRYIDPGHNFFEHDTTGFVQTNYHWDQYPQYPREIDLAPGNANLPPMMNQPSEQRYKGDIEMP